VFTLIETGTFLTNSDTIHEPGEEATRHGIGPALLCPGKKDHG